MSRRNFPIPPGGIERRARTGFHETLVANSGDVCTILDEDGVIRYHSPGIAEILGYPQTAGVGLRVTDIVHKDDKEKISARIAECLATPHSTFTERFRLRHANGQWHWLEGRARNLMHEPNIEGLLIVSRDINELVRLRDHIEHIESEAQIALWRWEKGNPAPFWTPTLARMFGYEKPPYFEDGRWNIHLIHPEDRESSLAQYQEAADAKRAWFVRQRMLCADGTYRYFDIHTYYESDLSGEVIAAAGVITDATDMVGKEEALLRNEQQNQLIAQHAIDMIARHAPSGALNFISPSVERTLGYTPEEAIQHDILANVHPDDQASFFAGLGEMTKSDKSVTVTFRLPHKAGHYVWLETTLQPLRNRRSGRLEEVLAISRDVSERKRYESELLRARERAEAASRTKSQFLANMSHELRTPLNAIIGFSDIIRQQLFGPIENEKYREYVDLIHDSGSLLLELISDILDMSKIEAGKMQLHMQPTSITDLAEASVRIIGARAEEKRQNVSLAIHPSVEKTPLVCDERAVKQILLNLLSNAVKFTPEGGSVGVEIVREGSFIAIEVADSGIGIPQEQLPRLTRPFEQVASESHISHEGSGLGLALVKALTDLHGGKLSIESEEGEGTKVRVTLPLAPTGQLDLLDELGISVPASD